MAKKVTFVLFTVFMKLKSEPMKALFWPVCCAGLLSLCSCGPRVARVESVDVVPRPVTVEASEGAFDLTRSTKICLLSDDTLLLDRKSVV